MKLMNVQFLNNFYWLCDMNLFVYQNQGIQCNCFNNANEAQQSGLKPSRNFLSSQNPLQFHRVTKSTESKIQKQQNSKIRTSLRRQKPRTPNQSRTFLYPNQQQQQHITFHNTQQNIANSTDKYGNMGVLPKFINKTEIQMQNSGGFGTGLEMKRPLISRNQIPKQSHQQFKIDFNTLAKPYQTSKNAQIQNGHSYKISQTSIIPNSIRTQIMNSNINISTNNNSNKNMAINFSQRQPQQQSTQSFQAYKLPVQQQQIITPMSSRGVLNNFTQQGQAQGQGQGNAGIHDVREIKDNRAGDFIYTQRREKVNQRNINIQKIQENQSFGLRHSIGSDLHHNKGVTINYAHNYPQSNSIQRNEHKILYQSPTVSSIDNQNMKSSRDYNKYPISKPSTPISQPQPVSYHPSQHHSLQSHHISQSQPQTHPNSSTSSTHNNPHHHTNHHHTNHHHPTNHNPISNNINIHIQQQQQQQQSLQPQPFRMILKQIQSVADQNQHNVDDQLSQVIGRGGAGWQRGSQYNYVDQSFGEFYTNKDKDQRLVTQTHATRASNIKNSSMIYENFVGTNTSDSHQFIRR